MEHIANQIFILLHLQKRSIFLLLHNQPAIGGIPGPVGHWFGIQEKSSRGICPKSSFEPLVLSEDSEKSKVMVFPLQRTAELALEPTPLHISSITVL